MSDTLKLPILLVISDNPSIFHWMKKNLFDRFFLIEAATESHALEVAQSTNLDFIFLDSLFEESDSLALSRKLRQINPATPIFLITGRLKKSFRDAAIDSGITDFISDQLSLEEIEARTATSQKTSGARKKTDLISRQINVAEHPPHPGLFEDKLLLNEKARYFIAKMKRLKEAVVLLLIRIDHFEELQKSYSIPVIEEVLDQLQDRMKRNLRLDDLLTSASKGFFFILLPHTSVKEAHEFADKLRKSVQHQTLELQKQTLHITISIVITPLEENELQNNKIAALAKRALDEEKTMANLILSMGPKNQ